LSISITTLIVFARVLGVCWVAPSFSAQGLGARTRLLLAGMLAFTIGPMLYPKITLPANLSEWAGTLCCELGLGAMLGASASLIIAGARQAGEMVGAQAGLSTAALFDPDAGEEMTPTGHLYGLIALAVFLLMDGPLLLIRALIESYDAWPASGFSLTQETARSLFGRVGNSLALTLKASAPVAAALTLAGLAIALAARNAPALPFTAMALPIRASLGLVFVLLGLVALIGTLSNAWADWPASLL